MSWQAERRRGASRRLIGPLASVVLVLVAVAARGADVRLGASALGPSGARAHAVAAVGMTVGDLDRSVAFFSDVLGFRPVEAREVDGRPWELLTGVFGARSRIVRLVLGDEAIELTEFLAPRGRPYPADTRGNDRWFQHIAIVVSDIDRAYAHLLRHRVAHASTAPQRLPDWNPNAAGIRAFYFRSPDGHFLEAISFPPGKGEAKWQTRAGQGAFLGIDHTAIVVRDTEQAVRFYRDGLGLVIVGGSENHGLEQERLNNVFGARLRITTLAAKRGPGVELLEYLAPATGRPAPVDLASNDLAHWQTTVVVDDAASWLAHRHGGSLVSPDVVPVDRTVPGYARGLLVRDPDGHGVRLVETTRRTDAPSP